ncbi:MAG: hypothetical protein OEQ90_05415 [Gammaproteobacteria bacterium]|nr:hypothetical protein [Gammaproteobacteria bacterium]
MKWRAEVGPDIRYRTNIDVDVDVDSEADSCVFLDLHHPSDRVVGAATGAILTSTNLAFIR